MARRKNGYKRIVDNKMRDFGDIDHDKKIIRINKSKKKNKNKGEILDSIIHEEVHRKHPKMREKNVKKRTKKEFAKMSGGDKAKLISRYKNTGSGRGKSMAKKKLGIGKAKEILKHGEVRGEPLTEKQKGLFGLIAGGGTPTRLSKVKGFYHDVATEVKPPK